MSRLYQIPEPDLEVLERELPELCSLMWVQCNDPLIRKRWELVKEILSNIRWDGGIPTECKKIDVDEEGEETI